MIFENRKKTQQQRIIDRLFSDIVSYEQDDYFRMARSGFSHEEALEYMNNNYELRRKQQ
jgi:hypothetical protein